VKVRARGERGDTLIEVLIALLVLGLTALALIIAFSTSISASQRHRDIATANIVLGTASQEALSQIEQNPNFFGCQAPGVTDTAYVSSNVTLSVAPNYDSYTAQIDSVEYWNGTGFQSTCVANSNPPLQVVIEVDGNGEKYYNTFVVDLPSGNLGLAADLSNGVISQLVFGGQPGESATGSSGVPFSPQPVVSGLDSNDQVVRNNLTSFVVEFEGNPAATITGCTSNDPNGVATFSGCIITGPAGTYHLHVAEVGGGVDSDPNGLALNENSFHPLGDTFWESAPNWYSTTLTVVVAGAPDKVAFAPAPTGGASGASLSTQPTIKIETSLGAVDTNQNSTVTLSLTGGSLTGCASVNGPVTTSPNGETISAVAHAGVLALTGCSFSGAIFYNGTASPPGKDATNYTITASYTGAISTSSQLFVSGPGAATQLVFIQQPSGVSGPSPSAAFPVQPQVEIEDAFGNPVYTLNGPVTIAFDASDAVHENLSGCSGSMTANTAIEVFSACAGSAYGGNLKLLASYNGLKVDSSPFTISTAVGSLKFTTSPVAGPSGDTFTTQPVVTIYDTTGSIDTGYAGSITLTPSAGGALSGCTDLTPNNGVVDVATCLFSGNAGSPYTLTASVVVSGNTVSGQSQTFSPSQAGTATQVQFTNTVAAGATAGSLMATQPIVKIEDSQGNVVTSSTATITLTSSGGTLAGCTNLTAVAGVVNVANCTFGGVIGSPYTLTATSLGLTSAQSNSFSNTMAGTEAGVSVAASPTAVSVDNVTNVQLTFQVVDNWGNDTVSNGTTSLTVSSNSTGGFFNTAPLSSGTLGVATTVMIPSGSTSATAYYGDETAGSPTITAYDSQTTRRYGSASLTISPATPTQLVYLTPPPATRTAGSTFAVTVADEDQFGNITTSDNSTAVTLSATNGRSNGGFQCVTPLTTAVTGGVVVFQNCQYTSASVTPYTLTASATGLTSATATTTVSAGNASKMVIWGGDNQSATISSAFASPMAVLVTDSNGNVVSGVTVTFTSPNGNKSGTFASSTGSCVATGGTITHTCTAVTNAQGVASSLSFTAGSTTGTYNVTVTSPGLTTATFSETNTNGTLMFLTAAQSFTSVVGSPGTTSGSVVIQAQDGNGNPVIQKTPLTVTVTYVKTGVTPASPITVTIPAGSSIGSFTLAAGASTTAGSFVITAAAPGYASTTQTETVRTVAVAGSATVTTTSPQTVTLGGTATFPVKITNLTGGTLYYEVVAVNGTEAGENPTVSACTTITHGSSVTINEQVPTSATRSSGSYTLDFVVESFTNRFGGCGGTTAFYQGDGTLVVNAGSAATIAINGGYGQTTTAGSTFANPLSAVVTDSASDPVAGVLVTFTAPTTGSSGTFLAAANGGTCLATGGIAVTSCTATTNVNGIASSLTFSANAVTGSYAVNVTAPGTVPNPLVFEEENQ
jgi:type II secretory pathway pseudopilin PulG